MITFHAVEHSIKVKKPLIRKFNANHRKICWRLTFCVNQKQ